MKLSLVIILVVFCGFYTSAQDRLLTRAGTVSFNSDAPLEKIQAQTNTAASVLDKKTGLIEFSVLIRSFRFRKALMQEHFNENYLESDKFPKSSFIGKIDDFAKIDFDKDAEHTVAVSGKLMIHGVTRVITTPASISIKNGSTTATAAFTILLSDYNIAIPNLVKDKISETVSISVNLKY